MSSPSARLLSKSKLLTHRQCARKLWLEINRKDLLDTSEGVENRFLVGQQLGALARRLYDPRGTGTVLNIEKEGVQNALTRTKSLLLQQKAIFEAGFSARGALAFADILLPVRKRSTWRLVEVKSSGSVKDYHLTDASIQYFVAAHSGVSIDSVSIAHIDSKWVYPGNGDYKGLLKEVDVTAEAKSAATAIDIWIADAQSTLRKRMEPKLFTGRHCSDPFECGFSSYCKGKEPQPRFPASWLPRVQTKLLREFLAKTRDLEIAKVPNELLNERQLRVKNHTLSRKPFFDSKGAANALKGLASPAYFMDFETVAFAIPIWARTRPYQQIPFQFSVQSLQKSGEVKETQFLELSGSDPSEPFARALITACADRGPIFVYNASFEIARIKELAERFSKLRKSLLALIPRVIDLRPIAERFYYHPAQQGSWSLKAVLPNIAPSLVRYDALVGVQDGETASNAYLEAIATDTIPVRRDEIRRQLTSYCRLDTLALVAIFHHFKTNV